MGETGAHLKTKLILIRLHAFLQHLVVAAMRRQTPESLKATSAGSRPNLYAAALISGCTPFLNTRSREKKKRAEKMPLKNADAGFPGGAVVENLPANAGDTGSSPGLGGSHMPQSNWAPEPQLLSLRVWSLCSATGEAAMVRGPRTAMKSGLRLPQLEKALAQKRRPNTAINK